MDDRNIVGTIARHVGETWARGSLAKVSRLMRDVVASEFPVGNRYPRLADGLVAVWESAHSSSACLEACRRSMRAASLGGRDPSDTAVASMLTRLALETSSSAFAAGVATAFPGEVLALVRRDPLTRASQLVRHVWDQLSARPGPVPVSSTFDAMRDLVREATALAFGDGESVAWYRDFPKCVEVMDVALDVCGGDYSALPDHVRACVAARRGDTDAMIDNLVPLVLRRDKHVNVDRLIEILLKQNDGASMRRLAAAGARFDQVVVEHACRLGSLACIEVLLETCPYLIDAVREFAEVSLLTGRVDTYLEIVELVGPAEEPPSPWRLVATSSTGMTELERRGLLPVDLNPYDLARRAAIHGNWDLVRWLRDQRDVVVDGDISQWSYATGMREVREFCGTTVPSEAHYHVAVQAGASDAVEHLEVEHGMAWSLGEIAARSEYIFQQSWRVRVDGALLRPRPPLESDDGDWAKIFETALEFGPSDHRLERRILHARPEMVPAIRDLSESCRRGLVDVSLEIARRLTCAGVAWHVPENTFPCLREMLEP